MLYCSTSSQYRTAFLRVISCGRLHARGRWGHGDYSGGDRAGRNEGTQIARSFRRRPGFGFGRRRAAPMESGSGTISPMGSVRFRGGGEQNNELITDAARGAGGLLTVNCAAYSPSRHSAQQTQTESGTAIAIELRPMAPLALDTQYLNDSLANGFDVNGGEGSLGITIGSNGSSHNSRSSKFISQTLVEESNTGQNTSITITGF